LKSSCPQASGKEASYFKSHIPIARELREDKVQMVAPDEIHADPDFARLAHRTKCNEVLEFDAQECLGILHSFVTRRTILTICIRGGNSDQKEDSVNGRLFQAILSEVDAPSHEDAELDISFSPPKVTKLSVFRTEIKPGRTDQLCLFRLVRRRPLQGFV
jgi:hypothetical protein